MVHDPSRGRDLQVENQCSKYRHKLQALLKIVTRAGADPASKFRGGEAISVIFGIQAPYGFTTVREMKYTSQHCCGKTMDDRTALYRECCFPNCKIFAPSPPDPALKREATCQGQRELPNMRIIFWQGREKDKRISGLWQLRPSTKTKFIWWTVHASIYQQRALCTVMKLISDRVMKKSSGSRGYTHWESRSIIHHYLKNRLRGVKTSAEVRSSLKQYLKQYDTIDATWQKFNKPSKNIFRNLRKAI